MKPIHVIIIAVLALVLWYLYQKNKSSNLINSGNTNSIQGLPDNVQPTDQSRIIGTSQTVTATISDKICIYRKDVTDLVTKYKNLDQTLPTNFFASTSIDFQKNEIRNKLYVLCPAAIQMLK